MAPAPTKGGGGGVMEIRLLGGTAQVVAVLLGVAVLSGMLSWALAR